MMWICGMFCIVTFSHFSYQLCKSIWITSSLGLIYDLTGLFLGVTVGARPETLVDSAPWLVIQLVRPVWVRLKDSNGGMGIIMSFS